MENAKPNKKIKLVETERKSNKQERFLECPIPKAVPNYKIPKEFDKVCEKYGLPEVMPSILKSTLVSKIMHVSRPTAIKLLKQMGSVSVSTNLKRHHLRVEAPLFLKFLKHRMEVEATHELAEN